MKTVLVTSLILIAAASSYAQKGFEVGGSVGVAHYFGDINTTFRVNRPGLAAGLIGRYNFNSRICFRVAANYARVSGFDSDSDNAFQLSRNLSFRSDIVEGIAVFEFNFLPYLHGSRDEFFTPYMFAGLGFTYFNSEAELDGEWVPLQPLGTEGQPIGGEYNKGTMSIAYGFGFKMDVDYKWSFNVELGARSLFSDYLDDVSTVYPNRVELQALRGDRAAMLSDRSGEVGDDLIGEEGRQRGTSSTNDAYGILSVGFVYYLGQLECPTISRPR